MAVRKQLYAVNSRPPGLQLIRIVAQITLTIALYEFAVARLIMKLI